MDGSGPFELLLSAFFGFLLFCGVIGAIAGILPSILGMLIRLPLVLLFGLFQAVPFVFSGLAALFRRMSDRRAGEDASLPSLNSARENNGPRGDTREAHHFDRFRSQRSTDDF